MTAKWFLNRPEEMQCPSCHYPFPTDTQHEFWKGEILFKVQSGSTETWDLFLVLGNLHISPDFCFLILLSVKRSFSCLSTLLFFSLVYSIVSLECYWRSGWGWGRELEKSRWVFMLCKLVMPEYINIRSVLGITKENFPTVGITIFCFKMLVASMWYPTSPFPLARIHLVFISILFLFSKTVHYYTPSMHTTKRFHALTCTLRLSSISWKFLQFSQR